jgi:hypothetical protein
MAGAVTNELIYEVLKQIQADMSAVKETQADHTRQFIEVRKQIYALANNGNEIVSIASIAVTEPIAEIIQQIQLDIAALQEAIARRFALER